MIIKAKVLTESSEDAFGRVRVTSPRIWLESELLDVFNQIPLNVDDIVYVFTEDDFSTALVLGKCRDNNFKTNSKNQDWVVIYESVKEDKWTVISGIGEQLLIENSQGLSMLMDGEKIQFNEGSQNLIFINELTDKLNNLVTQVGDIVSKYNAHTHPYTSPSGPAVTSPTTSTASNPSRFSASDYQDEKIKH